MRRFSTRRRQGGAVQVEFVLAFLLVIFLVAWIWEMVMVTYTYTVISDAAKEGIRYAIVHGVNNRNCSGPNACLGGGTPDTAGDNIKNVVKDYAKMSLHDTSAINVVVNWPEGSSEPPALVTVDVTYPYIPYINLPWSMPVVRARAQSRIVN